MDFFSMVAWAMLGGLGSAVVITIAAGLFYIADAETEIAALLEDSERAKLAEPDLWVGYSLAERAAAMAEVEG